VECLAYRGKGGTTLWLANLTAGEQKVQIAGAKGALFGRDDRRGQFRESNH